MTSPGTAAPRPLEIGVIVNDLPRQVAFYRDGLGCTEQRRVELSAVVAEQTGMGASFPVTLVVLGTPGGGAIKLLQPHTELAPPRRTESLIERGGVAYLTFDVDDLDGARARLLAAGAILRSKVARLQVGPEVAVVFLDDPEGNTIELLERHRPGSRS